METTPLVIAHRGASGYLPEHTLAAYRLAIRMGADYVEPDLVATADGVLVARHENEISATTDVAARAEFADRRTTKVVSGRVTTGWFTEDFSLAELRTLRAVERLPRLRPGSARYDGRFSVPTFDEVLDLVAEESSRRGQVVGVYPETKHPSYFSSLGLPLEEPLARTGAPYDLRAAGDARTFGDLLTPVGLREVSTYADAVGVDKQLVIPRDGHGNLCAPTSLVAEAHRAGLRVHAFTFRDERRFLPSELRGHGPRRSGEGAAAEYLAHYDAGVDAVFSDHADTALRARAEWLRVRAQSSSGMRTQPIR